MTGQEKKIKISELPASVTFTGLWTLGYQVINGKKTSVRVSLSEIQAAYEDALSATSAAQSAATAANSAASKANGAADTAIQAATLATKQAGVAEQAAQTANAAANQVGEAIQAANEAARTANAAAGSVNESIQNAETATKNAEDATQAANDAAAEANEAKTQADKATAAAQEATTAANNAATNANEKAGLADTATQNANKATEATTAAIQAANKATEDANAATEAANQAKKNADTATAAAQEATTAANNAATNANEKAGLADTATQHANTATENANTATTNATAATEVMQELNAHPMKPQGGYWFQWDLESHAYVNTGIQAKGDVGSSFKIIGRYDTLEELKQAVPDGTNVDGVYAVGATEPYSYYAWVVVDGVWQWDNQGQLRGAEGKSAYDVWAELPENAGKTTDDYFDWLSPLIDEKTGRWTVQGIDTGIRAKAIDAKVTVKEEKPDTYVLHVKSAAGEFDTPNLRGFDVKVIEAGTNTPDCYQLVITTVDGTLTTPNLKGASGTAVRDIDHVPGEEDTHFTEGGTQYAWSIGDEVRYYDAELEEYIFYKLNDITPEGKAVWKEAGSGGGRFEGETITVNVASNQSTMDENLMGTEISIKYGDTTLSVAYIGAPVILQVPADMHCLLTPPTVEGYKTPDTLEFDSQRGGERVVNLYYQAEKVIITATADDGEDCSAQTITVKAGEKTLLEQTVGEGVSVLVPLGTEYTVSGSGMNGHKTPSFSFTASEATRQVELVYMYILQNLLIFDTTLKRSDNITVENAEQLDTFYQGIRRCLAKRTGNGVAVCFLSDTNTNQYYGGTAALLDGTEGDVMTFLSDLYYKHEQLDHYRLRYCLNTEQIDANYVHFPASLIGTYKGYVEDGKLYSRSGVTPTVDMTFDDFLAAAKARGTGYQLIDFAQHSELAMLLYAKYRTRNIQSILGSGGVKYNENNTTGSSNATGITDTTPETATGYVCGLGIEGLFGGFYEYMQGLYYKNGIWHITDPDGTKRTIEVADLPTGWISNMALEEGPYFDMIPIATKGSGSTYYADYTETVQSEYIPLMAARSCFTGSEAYQDDGIGYINALNTSYIPSEFYGTRLAYRGNIEVIDDVEEFKALPII